MKIPFLTVEDKVVCLKCKKPVSLRITDEYTSELCLCQIILWYPPNKTRPYGIRTIISREAYDKDLQSGRQKCKLERNMDLLHQKEDDEIIKASPDVETFKKVVEAENERRRLSEQQ